MASRRPRSIAADVPGRLFGDDRMIFTHVMPVQQLPPGRYVLRALVSFATRPLKTLTRPFEVAATAPAAALAEGASAPDADADVFLPVDEEVFVQPFQRDEAVKPEVVKLFRDRLAPGAQAAFDAGVTALAAGDYRKAEASLKSGVEPDIDSTSLLVYLGAVYAANDDDMQAVGAWQTALFGGGDIPQLYAWLTQAQLRRHSLPDAQEVLVEAHEKWPSDPRFTGPLASVYATFGRGSEAALLLEQYSGQDPGRYRSGARRRRMAVPDSRGRACRARRRHRSRAGARVGRAVRERSAAAAGQAVAGRPRTRAALIGT